MDERELLASLRPWARRQGSAIADGVAARAGVPRDWAARYFQDIFRAERRLHDAPERFLGAFPAWLDAIHDALRSDPPEPARISKRFGGQAVDAEVLHAAERALARAFFLDAQAVAEAAHRAAGEEAAALRATLEGLRAEVAELHSREEGLRAELDAAARALDERAASAAADAERHASAAGDARAVVEQAAAVAGEARELTRTGVDAAGGTAAALAEARGRIEDAATAITALAGRSEQIGGIVKAIQDIASQTTVLAINAGIEAYHAGEQGAGFAVLAGEVRRLAERASKSAADAAELIAGIRGETDDAVEIVRDAAARAHAGTDASDRARAALEEIGAAIERLTRELDGLARLTGELN
jgi:methyl-accepting chemotaxis protein